MKIAASVDYFFCCRLKNAETLLNSKSCGKEKPALSFLEQQMVAVIHTDRCSTAERFKPLWSFYALIVLLVFLSVLQKNHDIFQSNDQKNQTSNSTQFVYEAPVNNDGCLGVLRKRNGPNKWPTANS